MKNSSDYLKALSLFFQIGITIATPIVLGAILGNYIDNKIESGSIVSIILIILGVIAGFRSAYILIMRVMK
jgi:F0F1-type ATP synthase assembly protein I